MSRTTFVVLTMFTLGLSTLAFAAAPAGAYACFNWTSPDVGNCRHELKAWGGYGYCHHDGHRDRCLYFLSEGTGGLVCWYDNGDDCWV